MKITNNKNIALPLAVWLCHDTYDGASDPNTISATSLLKPIKSIVLERTLPIVSEIDVSTLIASRLGTAVHTAIEDSWGLPHDLNNLIKLGFSEEAAKGISSKVVQEVRSTKEIAGYKVTGKFDFCFDGQVQDFKTTKTYSWINGSNTDNYIKQMSIYRWLNQDLITNDLGVIHYIFTDWSPLKALADKKYPQEQIISKSYQLMSLAETENFIKGILDNVTHYSKMKQEDMPQCTQDELWQEPTKYAYYKDRNKLSRSTKNFDSPVDANNRLISDGNTGVVITRPGVVKRCTYCNAAPVCKQREELEAQGLIK